MKSNNRTKLLVLLVAVLVVCAIPTAVGVFGARAFTDAQISSCDFVESAIGQLNPAEKEDAPKTRDACIAMVRGASFFNYIVFIIGAWVLYSGILMFVGGVMFLYSRTTSSKPRAPLG